MELAVIVGLPLAGPARIAAGILNSTVQHFAPMITDATGAELKGKLRENAEAAERVASTVRRLRYVMPAEGDGFTSHLQHAADVSVQDVLIRLEARAEAAVGRAGLTWGADLKGQHDMRDFLGGALPAAFALLFDKGTVAQRGTFISAVCQRLGLGAREPDAIKKSIARFRAARKVGTAVRMPGWMET